jgi:hypothetical protein
MDIGESEPYKLKTSMPSKAIPARNTHQVRYPAKLRSVRQPELGYERLQAQVAL